MSTWREYRDEGGADPLSERPHVTPEEAASLAYGFFAGASLERPRKMLVLLSDIVEDPSIQVRIGRLDQDHVENLAAVILNGGQFDDEPVLFTDQVGSDRKTLLPPFILSDGWHRKAAYQLAFQQTNDEAFLVMPCEVRYHEHAWNAAFSYAESANLTHGKQLTNREKYSVLSRRVLRGHEWYQLSASAIAKEIAVSRQTISAWLERLAAEHPDNDYAQAAAARSSVIGADGREYSTDGIQQSAAGRQYTQPQKTARAVVRDLYSAFERLQRMEYPLSDEVVQQVRVLIDKLAVDYDIDLNDL